MGNVYSPEAYAVHNPEGQGNAQGGGMRMNNPQMNGGIPARVGGGGLEHERMVGGLRADLAHLLAFPYRPNPPPASIYETSTVKSYVNINKDTLQLVKDEHNASLYRVQFVYDAQAPCVVRLYFVAKETGGGIQGRIEIPPVPVDKGYGVLFSQPVDHPFDVSPFKDEDLVATSTSTVFPVVIVIQALPDDYSKEDPSKPVILSQTTFATLLHCADDSYAIKVVKQKLPYLGQVYNLHDIYGLDYTGERESEGSRECVVCMSETRDTTILPCNHMCLCAGCAELMRTQTNKCPICRAPVKKLLSIKFTSSAEPMLVDTSVSSARPGAEEPKLQKSTRESEESDNENEDELLSRR